MHWAAKAANDDLFCLEELLARGADWDLRDNVRACYNRYCIRILGCGSLCSAFDKSIRHVFSVNCRMVGAPSAVLYTTRAMQQLKSY